MPRSRSAQATRKARRTCVAAPLPLPPHERTAVLLAAGVLAALLAWRTESSRDFGYHLATGRWILTHWSWPVVDSFTYPLAGRPYLDMHGLFQVLLALAHRAGGMSAIGVLRVLF